MKKPDYAIDAPMNVSNPYGRALPFQHNGAHHVLPTGVSTWPFEIAERIERKFAWAGVRMTFTPPPAPVAVPVVAESAPAVVAEPPLDTPASTDVETPAEPDPPAEPKEP